ncbi:MAG: peptide MFS transporter [Gemmataceae bacterium]|nr:peptide MFS transporter [Gemmataceae bacterium]
MLSRHPRGLFPLFFTEMWERFSFYCMMALLTLYMDAPESEGGLGFHENSSSQIYGFYKGFLYFTPLFGGLLADRLWGFTRTIFAGGIAMMAGHLALAGEGLAFFYAGLCLLIIGNGLFKPNISTMVGNLYYRSPDLKDQGYNIFYMGINIGAFIAPLVANGLKNAVGWHTAFGAAAVGMSLSLVIFYLCRKLVADGERPASPRPALDNRNGELSAPQRRESTEAVSAGFPLADRFSTDASNGAAPDISKSGDGLRIQALFIIFGVVVLFWMAFHQNGLTLSRWARDHTEPFLGIDFKDNAALTLCINPFLVIVLTPILVVIWGRLKRMGWEVSTPKKMAIGMVLTASCFLVMAMGGLAGGNAGRVSVFWLIGGYFLVTIGELCLSPMGLSVVSKLAPARHAGLFMGGWFVATAIGNYFSGAIGVFWREWSHSAFFFFLVVTSLGAAAVLALFLPRLEAAVRSVAQPPPTIAHAVASDNGDRASDAIMEKVR